jgi:magnesium-transporting ATPase (P-type)
MDILDNVIIGISIIVAAIPEGLPLAVTIALSFSSS